jgi:NAD(P)-dependent dehydrogenase (short-subunit alcohol dehydrogenase family)
MTATQELQPSLHAPNTAAVVTGGVSGIGSLVHAAGVIAQQPVDQLTAESWDAVMNVNLRALALTVRALLPDMRAHAGSAVVGIASINATLGSGLIPAYTASRGGMLSLVRSLADTLAADGIRINAVSPGQILTPMIKPIADQMPGMFGTHEPPIAS